MTAEDEALVAFVIWFQRAGFQITKPQLVSAANDIRRRRDPEFEDVGKNWYCQWLQHHPEVQESCFKPENKPGVSHEASSAEILLNFFKNLENIVSDYRIGASECWNKDECDVWLCSRGKKLQALVAHTTQSQRPRALDERNGESTTALISAANAAGESIPPWLIFKTFPTDEDWKEINADGAIHFTQSGTGFSNSEITLEWLHHFNIWSWKKSIQAQQSGQGLEDWFGCDAWLRDPAQPWEPPFEVPPVQRPAEDKIYRLLVIDGFTGHTTFEVFEYCIKFDIIVAAFPSDFHILQPLDVGVFQPLERAQPKIPPESLSQGNLTFTQAEFITAFQTMHDKGFTKSNIISGFEESGIYPPSAKSSVGSVFSQLQKKRETPKPSLLPMVGSTLRMPELLVERDRRLKRLSSRKSRGGPVQPPGDSHAAASQIQSQSQQQDNASRQPSSARMTKAQLQEGRRAVKLEMERVKKLWRDDQFERLEARQKRMAFKAWLRHTGKHEEFSALETRDREYAILINHKVDHFSADTAGSESQQEEDI